MAGSYYVLPQVKVFQEFGQAPRDTTQSLNPFVIGPNYQLIRHSDAGEKDDCTVGSYAGDALLLAWSANGLSGSIVDKTYYGVTLEDVRVKLGDPLAPSSCLDADAANLGSKFELVIPDEKSLVGTDPYFGIPVRAGDYVSFVDGAETRFSKIMSVSVGKVEDEHATATIKRKSTGEDASGLITLNVEDYVGEVSGSVKLIVTTEGTGDTAVKKVTWTSSIPDVRKADPVALPIGDAAALDLGKGIKVLGVSGATIPDGTYLIDIKLTEPIARDTITVADSIPASTASFTFYRHLDEVELDKDYLTVGDGGVTVVANAQTRIGAYDFTVVSGTAYLTQRNLRTDHVDGIYSFREREEIVNQLGVIHPDNPLAYGAQVMLLNCAAASIKYIGLTVDNSGNLDWDRALDRASNTTEVYAFAPLTEDRTVLDNVVAHCDTMSSEKTGENKAWRIAFFSCPTAKTRVVTPMDGDVAEKCKVSGKVLTCYSPGGEISTVSKFLDTVAKDDKVTVTTATGDEVTAKVVSVETHQKLTLDVEIPGANTALCEFEIVHTFGKAEYVAELAKTSRSFFNHRAYNVFPNGLRDTDGAWVSGMYAAAAVAALACSVAPQQPITNVEIKGFSDLPDVYATYSRDELDTIAAGGTFILMQDTVGGTVYVRHQISTEASGGNLNKTELSLTKNLDSISYYFADRFAPYHGRFNITEDLLAELRAILKDGLAHLETATETNKLIGPQLIADGTEIRSLYQDPTFKDRVYSSLSLNLPAPFNNFDLHLQVI